MLQFTEEDIQDFVDNQAYEFAFMLFATGDDDVVDIGEYLVKWTNYEQTLSMAVPKLEEKGIRLEFTEDQRILTHEGEGVRLEIDNDKVPGLNRGEPAVKIFTNWKKKSDD